MCHIQIKHELFPFQLTTLVYQDCCFPWVMDSVKLFPVCG